MRKRAFKKAVHLITSDHKFLSSCKKNFEWLDHYIVGSWIECSGFTEIDNQAIEQLKSEIREVKCIIFLHGLWPTQKAALELAVPHLHTTIGFLWGGDYTLDTLSYRFLYANQTRRLMQSKSRRLRSLPFFVFDATKIIRNSRQLLSRRRMLRDCLSSLDFVVLGWGEAESRFLPSTKSRLLPNFNPYYGPFPPSNKVIRPLCFDEKTVHILVGNSGTWTNNHIDVIQSIRRHNPELSLTFTLLLSYGDEDYIESLMMHYGQDSSVDFVTEFLSLDDFNSLVERHDFLALGSRRQQGSGFIRAAISNNKPILLFEDSIAHAFFKDIGADLNPIETDLATILPKSNELRHLFQTHQKASALHFQNIISSLIAPKP